jgi:ribosome recycling factor
MMEELFEEAGQSFDKGLAAFKKELSRLRTGRANLAILDGVKVEYYGSPTPLAQIASVNISDPKLITIKPWDKALIGAIEKSILAADVGITPSSDGNIVRLPIPPLTVERRKDLVKQVKKMAENARVAIRNTRRDYKSLLDSDETVPEDEQAKALKRLQDLTDGFIAKVDTVATEKEKEIMEQ